MIIEIIFSMYTDYVFILDKCVMWNLQELLSPMQYLSSDDESWYSWIVRGTNLLWRYIYTYLGASRVLNLYDVGYIYVFHLNVIRLVNIYIGMCFCLQVIWLVNICMLFHLQVIRLVYYVVNLAKLGIM